MSLSINPWSKQVGRSEVLKHGTLQDIAKLAPPNPKNKLRHSYVRLPGVRIEKGKVPWRGHASEGMTERQLSRRLGRMSRGATALRGIRDMTKNLNNYCDVICSISQSIVGKQCKYSTTYLQYETERIFYFAVLQRSYIRKEHIQYIPNSDNRLRVYFTRAYIVLCVKYTKKPPFRPVFRVSACTFLNSQLGEESKVYKHLCQDPVHEDWFLRGCVFYILLLSRRTVQYTCFVYFTLAPFYDKYTSSYV